MDLRSAYSQFFEAIHASSAAELIARLQACESCAARRAGIIELLTKFGDGAADQWHTARHLAGVVLWQDEQQRQFMNPSETP